MRRDDDGILETDGVLGDLHSDEERVSPSELGDSGPARRLEVNHDDDDFLDEASEELGDLVSEAAPSKRQVAKAVAIGVLVLVVKAVLALAVIAAGVFVAAEALQYAGVLALLGVLAA